MALTSVFKVFLILLYVILYHRSLIYVFNLVIIVGFLKVICTFMVNVILLVLIIELCRQIHVFSCVIMGDDLNMLLRWRHSGWNRCYWTLGLRFRLGHWSGI